MMEQRLLIKNAAQLVTVPGRSARTGAAMGDLGIVEDGAVYMEGGLIRALGPSRRLTADWKAPGVTVVDAAGRAVLPGFVDAHTHLIFAGYRPDEFAWRLGGESYMEILNRGGGILRTVRDTRGAGFDRLYRSGRRRLDTLLAMGVTTVEAKSGYGLDLATEIRQLEVMAALNRDHPVEVVPTYLGAHAVPPEFRGRPDDYVDWIVREVLPVVSARGLAEFCDVFCETGVFTSRQSRRVLQAAAELGLRPRLHADEITASGGAELAAELAAASADHLIRASQRGIAALAAAGVVATLLPATSFGLREPYARARAMVDAGCAVALGTDLNPGSCFTASIPLLFALATLNLNLTPEEAVCALTLNAAAALGRAESIGSLEVGKRADAVVLDFPSYRYLPYHMGMNVVAMVIRDGRVVVDRATGPPPENAIGR